LDYASGIEFVIKVKKSISSPVSNYHSEKRAAKFKNDVDVRDYFQKKTKGEVKEDDIKIIHPGGIDLAYWFEPTCQPAFA
jgi:hypothetical protein